MPEEVFGAFGKEVTSAEQTSPDVSSVLSVASALLDKEKALDDALVKRITAGISGAERNFGIDYSAEQVEAIRRLCHFVLTPYKAGDPVAIVLTGEAGSGKSTVIRAVSFILGRALCMTATTGRAAILVDGVTIDRALCIDRETWSVWGPSYLDKLMCGEYAGVLAFALDECSMAGDHMCNVINEILRSYGKKIIMIGDWYQAAPVKDEWPTQDTLLYRAETVYLQSNYRQSNGVFLRALNEVRTGWPGEYANTVFPAMIRAPQDTDVVLMATNREADYHNKVKLSEHIRLSGNAGFCIGGTFADLREPHKIAKRPMSIQWQEKVIDMTPAAPECYEFSVGCRVIITANNNKDSDALERGTGGLRYVNGDTGELVGFVYDTPECAWQHSKEWDPGKKLLCLVIKLDRTEDEVIVAKRKFIVKDEKGRPEFSYIGVPVLLAYAMTIHKSQGATIPRVWVNVGSLRAFPTRESLHGLLYVALSRVREPADLGISEWDTSVIYCAFAEYSRAQAQMQAQSSQVQASPDPQVAQ